MSIDINDMTIGQAKEINSLLHSQPAHLDVCETNAGTPFKIGTKYFIRTVTYAHTGKVKEILGKFLILESAAWIADTGRFYDALKTTQFDEIEPFTNDLILNVDSIVDATKIDGELPDEQK